MGTERERKFGIFPTIELARTRRDRRFDLPVAQTENVAVLEAARAQKAFAARSAREEEEEEVPPNEWLARAKRVRIQREARRNRVLYPKMQNNTVGLFFIGGPILGVLDKLFFGAKVTGFIAEKVLALTGLKALMAGIIAQASSVLSTTVLGVSVGAFLPPVLGGMVLAFGLIVAYSIISKLPWSHITEGIYRLIGNNIERGKRRAKRRATTEEDKK